jgi:hypothetical protein
MRLGVGQKLRCAVDGGRGAEDEGLHPGCLHGLHQDQAAGNVVAVVLQRFLRRLADGLQPGKVQHALDGLRLEQAIEQRTVAHVALHALQRLPGDALDARQRLRAAVAEVVEHHEAVARALERHTGVGTDVAGAAGDEQGGGFRACRHGTVWFGAWVADCRPVAGPTVRGGGAFHDVLTICTGARVNLPQSRDRPAPV